jgi:TetR/AcrR family transcriptional regulator, cholesterol catabolism regulator
MPKGIPLTDKELDRRRHQIFNASVHLFLEKGFQETSMQEIAVAAGMGKSSLYDYFKTKDEILFSVVEDEIYDLTELAKQIAARDLPPAEKLKQIILAHLKFLQGQKDFYTKLMFEVQRLSLEDQRQLQVKRHAYQDLLCGLIEQAIQEGTFRPVTPLLATRILISMLSPAVFTSRPTGTPEETMEETIGIFYRGVSN